MSGATAIWHDVECGGYDADLLLWDELAGRHGGPVLELGCGTGRVALRLAARGHRVYGVDRDPELIASLLDRASDSPPPGVERESDAVGGGVIGLVGDARGFELPEPVALALAPMQLLQLLAGAGERVECLAALADNLQPGGLFAAAIVEEPLEGFNREEDVVPDSREIDGWVYSSLPIEARVDAERIAIRRLRKAVSPAGDLDRSEDLVELRRLEADAMEAEATQAGFTPAGRREIPPTLDHVGSTVVLLEASG